MDEAEAEIRRDRFITAQNGRNNTYHSDHTNPDAQLAPDSPRLSGNYGIHFGDGLLGLDVDDVEAFHESGAADRLPLSCAFAVRSAHAEDEPTQYLFAIEDNEGIEAALDELPGGSRGKVETDGCEIAFGVMMFIGPGSQRDADKCDSGHCNGECEGADSGWYEIADEGTGLPLKPEQLVAAFGNNDQQADLGDSADTGGGANDSRGKDPASEGGETTSGDGETDESDGGGTPNAMPPCYRHALETRRDPSDAAGTGDGDGPNVTNQEVNTYAAKLGLWAGYDADTVVEHMIEDYPPEEAGYDLDTDETRSQVERLSGKVDSDSPIRPPSPTTLKDAGILPEIAADACADHCVIHTAASTDGGTAAAGASAGGAAGGETGDGRPEPDYPLVGNYDGGYSLHHPSKDDDDDGWYKQLTNFEIEVSTFLRKPDGDGVEADLTVYPGGTGDTYDVTVPMTVFNETRPFKREIVTGRTTRFDGDTGDLNELREFVGGQSAPERIGVERIGLFGSDYDELVTPAGTLGANSWISEPDHAYVQQGIDIETKWSLGDDSSTFDSEAVAEVLETLPRTRKSDRLLPVLGWFYASGFRPLIHNWTGEFNILNVTGGTGAGKSSTLGTLWKLFGMDDDPLSVAEETKFAVTRSMAATNNVPVWFDEYKPATTESWRIDGFHGLLRTATRGGVVQRGNADKTTDGYTLSAPVAVSGEQRIQGSAEQRRCVMTTFSPSATDDGTDTARAYKELTGEGYLEDGEFVGTNAVDPQAHALAYHQFVAGYDADRARERWNTAAEDVADMIDALDEADALGSAARQGLQTVVFGLRLYREFAETVEADVAEIVDADAIESAVQYSGREFVGGGHKSHVDTLVELVAAAARAEYIEEDEHYSVVKSGSPAAEIRVNMTAAFDQITRYVRDHDVSADLLDTYGDYRDRFKEAHEENGGYVVSYRQYTRGVGRAIGIHARRATDALDGFEARAMNCEIIEDRGGKGETEEEESTVDLGCDVPDDAEGTEADARRIMNILCETGQPFDETALKARLGRDLDMSPNEAEKALAELVKRGDVIKKPGPKYVAN
ncbi:hypothetical protein [Halococcus agarilyticus]|uniref:hypothetical protein n=1 Tax=Halococcus agarilyticus TaxID=1232219 RepID=UPI0006782654|nr:hypothetical protein [Halococcus agarilyticus]